MRPPPAGATATLRIVVEDRHRAAFDDEDVHAVYGTAALAGHVEQVSRRLFAPGLDEGEEGVGAALVLRHVAPAAVGSEVELTATVTAATARRLVTAVEARHGDRVIATATFTQVVVPLDAWRAQIT